MLIAKQLDLKQFKGANMDLLLESIKSENHTPTFFSEKPLIKC